MAHYLGIDLPLKKEKLNKYALMATDFALMNGMVYRMEEEEDRDHVTRIGLALFPHPVPKLQYNQLLQLQPSFSKLWFNAGHDYLFLAKCIERSAQEDEHLGKLWNIHQQVKHLPLSEHRCLTILRNDFILSDENQYKQIEINTMGPVGAFSARSRRQYTKFMLERMGCHEEHQAKVPESDCRGISEALLAAWNAYGNKTAAILIIDDKFKPDEHYDLQSVIYNVYDLHKSMLITCKTYTQVADSATLRNDGTLEIEGVEIAVVYLRTGANPSAYDGDKAWSGRLLVEKSRAFMCPCIHMQLAGLKHVQKTLSDQGMVETYIGQGQAAREIRDTFLRQYHLDQTPEGDGAAKMAVQNPHKWVLKTERDGGGNNYYGETMVTELKSLEHSQERAKFVLQEKVTSVSTPNYLLLKGDGLRQISTGSKRNYIPQYSGTTAEIGMFSSILNCGSIANNNACTLSNNGDHRDVTNGEEGSEPILKQCGHLVRIMMDNVEEGRISESTAVFGSLILG